MTGVLRGVRRCAAAALVVAGAAAVLAVLAAGLPWLMWHVTGWPLPRHVPSLAALKAGLTARESGRFILDVITCAGWACWAAFLADVLLEAAWQIRHLPELARDRAGARRTARLRERAAGLSPPRALAAVLIGGVLLGMLAVVRGTGGVLAGSATPRVPVSHTAAVHAATPPNGPPGQAARSRHGRQEDTGSARPHRPGETTQPAAPGPAAGSSLNQPAKPGDAAAGASPGAPGPGMPDSGRPVPGGATPPPVMTLTAAQQHAPAQAASPSAWYRVKEGDNLWDIAADHLGDGEKWHEIYALNEGRPQPGGQELTDPGLIEPGWTLRLPPAPGHRPGPGPARTRVPRAAGPPRPASPPPHHPQGPHAPQPAPAGHRQQHGTPGISLPSGGLAGLTLAAAVAAALVIAGVQRRRRYRPGKALTSRLDPDGPPVPPPIAALRRAAHPPPNAATTDPDHEDAYFTDEDTDPEDTLPRGTGTGPVPRDAARGAATPADPPNPAAVPPPLPDGPEPPGVIALGVRGGSEVSADIAAGGLGLTGPGAPAAARAILASLLARAVPGQPGGPAEVIVPAADTALLLPGHHTEDISGTGFPGLIVTPSLDAALGQAEALIVRRARLSGSQDTGQDPPRDPAGPPLPAAALIASPARAATQRLAAVLQAGRGAGVAGILLGDWPPGITCHVAADGTITSADPSMDGIRLFNLDASDTTAVISLLREACGTPPGEYYPAPVPSGPPPSWPAGEAAREPSPAASGLPLPAPAAEDRKDPPGDIPADAAAEPSGGASPARPHTAQSPPLPASAASGPHPGTGQPAARPGPQEPRPAGDAGPPQQNGNTPGAPGQRIIRVEILGPLRITARGQEIRGGLRKARELLAFLAVHPDGVTGEAISEALWPETAPGHGTGQRKLALRKLRDLLRDAAGLTGPMLITLTAERYRLDPAFIATDVADFQAALDAARHAADDAARLAACQEAAALYRGPLADGAGYDWAEPYAEAARRRALDAWTRIAELLEPGDPDQALAALETALGHDPFNEYLYQRIMRLQAAAGRPDGVRRTLRLLEKRLTEIGVTPGTQTRQAAAALLGMPGPQPRAGGPQPPAPLRPAPAARQGPPGRHPAR